MVVGGAGAVRIFVADLHEGELAIRGDEHHYLSHVRRARVGDTLELVDGEGQRAVAAIARITEHETIVRAEAPQALHEPGPRVRVLVPLIKGDRMDVCIEKLVEVGADELVVWPAARSVVQLAGGRRAARVEHYQGIARAAARQSRRARVPQVGFADSLASAIATASGARVVLDPDAPPGPFPAAGDITLVSGPEGGLAPEELARFDGWTRIGLGPRVLRAETAPIVAVALVRAQTGS